MVKPVTGAQQRIVEAAEPGTERLSGTAAQLDGLVRRGLAFRHPRPPHACFLTPAGHRLREGDAPAPPPPPDPGGGDRPAGDGGFRARTGVADDPPGGAARLREARAAWSGMRELRRMTRADGATDRLCGWERQHPVRAAALALEAAGFPPASQEPGGYQVRESPQPDAVQIAPVGGTPPDRVEEAWSRTLTEAGWQVSHHQGVRPPGPYLLASPRRD
ncbi:hypothetical protein [Streptomyces diastaticus]|uniref:hypothetical protein n=1 Tax=Streptomyces diastaticus TaxID=1956 RepID=UPI0038057299